MNCGVYNLPIGRLSVPINAKFLPIGDSFDPVVNSPISPNPPYWKFECLLLRFYLDQKRLVNCERVSTGKGNFKIGKKCQKFAHFQTGAVGFGREVGRVFIEHCSIKTVYWIQLSSLGSSKLEPHELNLERSHHWHCSNSSADTPWPASRTCKAQCKAFAWWTFPNSSKRLESIFLDAYRTPFPVHLDVWISWLQPISSGHCGEYFRSKMQHFYQLFCHFFGFHTVEFRAGHKQKPPKYKQN